uniref:Carn_acyltransf domain-containing protein n=1 Tax=Heterorhabditis bacteriophora TaxID=37862 RepID=A0A1I7XCG4_HETBA
MAYYSLYGEFVPTYESCSTAAFLKGRTECMSLFLIYLRFVSLLFLNESLLGKSFALQDPGYIRMNHFVLSTSTLSTETIIFGGQLVVVRDAKRVFSFNKETLLNTEQKFLRLFVIAQVNELQNSIKFVMDSVSQTTQTLATQQQEISRALLSISSRDTDLSRVEAGISTIKSLLLSHNNFAPIVTPAVTTLPSWQQAGSTHCLSMHLFPKAPWFRGWNSVINPRSIWTCKKLMKERDDVALFPKTALSWRVHTPDDISPKALSLFASLDPKIDILVLGVGDKKHIDKVRRKVAEFLKKHRIGLEIMDTVRFYSLTSLLITLFKDPYFVIVKYCEKELHEFIVMASPEEREAMTLETAKKITKKIQDH